MINYDQQLQMLSDRIDQLSARMDSGYDRFSDPLAKDNLKILLKEQLIDVMWNEMAAFSTFFESLDGWGSSGASVAVNRLFMQANGTNTVDYARKTIVYQDLFSYDTQSRFRTAFSVGSSSIGTGNKMKDIQSYVGTGVGITGTNNIFETGLAGSNHYGIYIDEDKIYGISSNGTSYTTTLLRDSLKSFDLFFVEIVHIPNERVDFYISEPSSGVFGAEVKPTIFAGSISRDLPTGKRSYFAEFSVKNIDGTTGDKEMNAGFVEVIQTK